MSPRQLRIVIAGVLAASLFACGLVKTRPIHNIENAPINVSSPSYDLADVTQTIITAGIANGWQMRKIKPGYIVGERVWRSHSARITVTYTLEKYSITYLGSTNLMYNGPDQLHDDPLIHKEYNYQVQWLADAIDGYLLNL
jgi:hypothetical protein